MSYKLFDRKLKLYLDTSVPNHLFATDTLEKQRITQIFFDRAKREVDSFYTSGILLREIEKAPTQKYKLLLAVVENIPLLEYTVDSEKLAQEYLRLKIVTPSSIEDARHVAVATVHNMDAVVSWNFKHLVNLRRAYKFNLVNKVMGYKSIEIVSPQEVIE